MRVQTKGNHGMPFISIRNKLLFIFLIPTIMLLSINAYINAEINTMIDDISGIYASNAMLNDLQISLTQVHRYLETFLDTRDTEAIEGYLRNQQEFSNILERLNGRLLDDDSMITQKNIRSISEEYIRTANRAVEAKRGRNVVKYKEYYDDADRLFSYINSYIYSLNNRQLQRNSQNYEALFTSLKYSETANLTILCMTSALVTLLVFLLTRGITDPLRRLAEAAEQVARGSLIAEVSGPVANDEVGIVTAAFNQMVASLKDNMEQARQRIELESAMKEKQLLMEAHLKDTQLKYLQSQINPHFLFNTLNACAQLAMLEGADRTYTYVQNVADFYRYNVRKKDGVATLAEEIGLVDNYIYIINVRFSGEIHFIKEIEEGVTDVPMPAMILQPLVENALYHGIKLRRGLGHILVDAAQEDGNVRICVRDDGAGMTPERLQQLRQSLDAEEQIGFGLRTVYQRLRLLYGAQCSIELESEPNAGTAVTLRFPIRKEAEA